MSAKVDSQESEGARLRLGMVADAKLVARVLLTCISDNRMDVNISGDDGPAALAKTAIQAIAHGLPQGDASCAERLQTIKNAFIARVASEGYEGVELPLADAALSFEFDWGSGLMVGRHQALHGLADVDQALGQRIHAAIAHAFSQRPVQLAGEIEALIGQGDHRGAAAALEAGWGSTMALCAVPPRELLDALLKVLVEELDATARQQFVDRRLAVAVGLGRYDAAEMDAARVLNSGAELDDGRRASLDNVIAIAAVKRGETETALSIWRRVLSKPEVIDAGERGWIWRNFSMALGPGSTESERAVRLSADAFLEAGDKREAAASLMHLSHLLERSNAATALEQLDGMLQLATQQGLIGAELRAAIHHSQASRLIRLRSHAKALAAAMQAVELRRGVTGVEQELIASLQLAALSARETGNVEQAEQLDAESEVLEISTGSLRPVLARRIGELFTNFDRGQAEAITQEAAASGDLDLQASAAVACAVNDPNLDATARLRLLEAALRKIERGNTKKGTKQPVLLAIATVLRSDGQYERAVHWYRRVLEIDPLSADARDQLIDCLWQAEDWGGAAIFLKAQLELHGEAPGLLYVYARSLLEAGDVNQSLPVLTRALKLIPASDPRHTMIAALRDRALELGATYPQLPPRSPVTQPVLRDEIEQALRDFASFLAADKRMALWERPEPGAEYVWVSKPERRAQDLLHTFLKARFQTRISVFEEVATGAGRLDLLLALDGGLSVIIELKMCGFGYSSAYAAAGEDQIQHYMQQRRCHLGFLVVFDARLNKFGQALLQTADTGSDTICELFVDVRPRVSTRMSREQS